MRPRGSREVIEGRATATWTACRQMTRPALSAVRDSVQRAASLPARPGWECKAAAHAEIFRLLAAAAGTPAELGGAPGLIHDLMLAVGPAVDGMITSSRQRLLAHLHAGDAAAAALEMETHLRVLCYLGRLARPPGTPLAARRFYAKAEKQWE